MPRPKGSTNKDKEVFRDALLRYCDTKHINPFYYMVDLLATRGAPRELKFQAAKELAQYLQAKLRAVEVSGDPERPVHIHLLEGIATHAYDDDADETDAAGEPTGA